MTGEKFDIKKLALSPFSGIYWTKTTMFLIGACLILTMVYSVYRTFFKKPVSTQTIRAETGSNVTVIQQNERKKSFIPFVEGGVEQPSSDDWHTFIRTGLRFEW